MRSSSSIWLSLKLGQGEIRGLIGPNGSGKSTAFNVCTGIYRATSGDVRVNGQSIRGLRPDQYEFQMLLGVTEDLRRRIRAAGHPLRVYIPFGRDWYAYSVRRLRENPRLAGYVLKAMFGK